MAEPYTRQDKIKLHYITAHCAHACIDVRDGTHAHKHAYIHTRTLTYLHTNRHTYICTHVRTNVHA